MLHLLVCSTGTERMTRAPDLFQEVPVSNLGPDADYLDRVFAVVLSSFKF
jgi:hypothetical protein